MLRYLAACGGTGTNLMPVTTIGCKSGLIRLNISPRESGSQAGVGSSRGVPFQGQKIATFRPSTKPHVHDRYHPRQVGFCICLKNRSSRKTIVEFFRNAIGQVDSQKRHLVANQRFLAEFGLSRFSAYNAILMTQSIYSLRYQHLRKLLIEARKSQKISQTTLANSLGCVQTFVSKYERGERRLDVVEFLDVTRALGVDPHQIISEMQRKGQNQKAES